MSAGPAQSAYAASVPYLPPSGWIEPIEMLENAESDPRLGIFHIDERCPRIKNAHDLRGTDKPYSARRCGGCAPEVTSR